MGYEAPFDLYPSRRQSEPESRDRIDPVVHGTWHEGAPLGRDQTEAFDRDGYLVIEDAFSVDEMALLQSETGRLLGDPDALMRETVIIEPGREKCARYSPFTNRAR